MRRRSIPLAVLVTLLIVAFVFWAAPVAALEPGDPGAGGGSLGLVLLLTLGSVILWWSLSFLSRSARSWLSVFLSSPNLASRRRAPRKRRRRPEQESIQGVGRKERHERLLR